MSIRCTSTATSGTPESTTSSFSPLPQPSSTIVGASLQSGSAAATSRACCSRSRGLGARDAIPRQPADRIEQAGAERVVEIRAIASCFGARRRSRTTSAAKVSVRVVSGITAVSAARNGAELARTRRGSCVRNQFRKLGRINSRAVAGDAPFEHDVQTIEELGGVFRIRDHRGEARERAEDGLGPLPAVADQIVNAPRAGARRARAGRHRLPRREVEVAVRDRRRVPRPTDSAARRPTANRTRRDGTPLRSAGDDPASARRRRLRPGSHRPATPRAAGCPRTCRATTTRHPPAPRTPDAKRLPDPATPSSRRPTTRGAR